MHPLFRCTQHNAKHNNSVSNRYQQLDSLENTNSFTLSKVLLSAEDGQQLYDQEVAYTMKVLVESFPSLEILKPLISTATSASVKKSIVVPVKMLSKYINDNIILQQHIECCAGALTAHI